jgi:predicted HicB family RNase H-like nuclease
MLKHKGYSARIEFDQDDKIFVGRVIGIRDGVNFHGTTVAGIEQTFKESVDDYLSMCEKLGQQPEKPYSGKISLRVPADVHAAIACAAKTSGSSINQWITSVLAESVKSDV